uniref:HDC14877 n=1 Tax=Drosophila melanogaster TaxID=7227 RepID=Q6IJI0_DROME|nr:TPA_inf: HDC14877 [Drosophila melanogaster]
MGLTTESSYDLGNLGAGGSMLAPTRLPFQWSVGVAMVVVEGREEAMLALK